MPSLTPVIAAGLGALLVIPLLVFGGMNPSGTSCLPAAVVSMSDGGGTTSIPWDGEQVANAETIVSVGQTKAVPAWGWVIAVATAMQESRLRNLPGGDRDSIGLFQQRPSAGWGTPTQLRSPAYQAGKFYDALQVVPDWQRLPLTQAAQAIQRSAYPDAYAYAYAQWTAPAIALVQQLTAQPSGTGAPVLPMCGNPCQAASTATPNPGGGTAIGCPRGQAALARAATWLTAWNGAPVPYSMNTDPSTWFGGYRRDCSGYASMALGLPGPGLNTAGLAARSTPIPKAALQPGDLLINPAPGGTGHVVIFDRWADSTMINYLGYEQSGDGGTHHRAIPYPYYGRYPMSPYHFLN
jgi:hypothetical protein